ncbi:hypothetical protein [Prauserella flavalba]|uniref:hypothetical protein n=1 Tax=Prauserella flavalba TaxID=1477506 RepID=UPI00143D6D14|nr:hypothetical protein [Prauserella flavalba]
MVSLVEKAAISPITAATMGYVAGVQGGAGGGDQNRHRAGTVPANRAARRCLDRVGDELLVQAAVSDLGAGFRDGVRSVAVECADLRVGGDEDPCGVGALLIAADAGKRRVPGTMSCACGCR